MNFQNLSKQSINQKNSGSLIPISFLYLNSSTNSYKCECLITEEEETGLIVIITIRAKNIANIVNCNYLIRFSLFLTLSLVGIRL